MPKIRSSCPHWPNCNWVDCSFIFYQNYQSKYIVCVSAYKFNICRMTVFTIKSVAEINQLKLYKTVLNNYMKYSSNQVLIKILYKSKTSTKIMLRKSNQCIHWGYRLSSIRLLE